MTLLDRGRMRRPLNGLGLVATGTLAAWIGVALAQNPDEGPCHQACAQQETHCLEACAHHDDPMECEADCRDVAWNCRDRCRD
jgi:hypothetical protein